MPNPRRLPDIEVNEIPQAVRGGESSAMLGIRELIQRALDFEDSPEMACHTACEMIMEEDLLEYL